MSERLSDRQRLVLTALANYQGTATPQALAHEVDRLKLAWYGNAHGGVSWQGVTRTMGSLVRRGLATRRSLPKQVSYQVTEAGKEAIRP